MPSFLIVRFDCGSRVYTYVAYIRAKNAGSEINAKSSCRISSNMTVFVHRRLSPLTHCESRRYDSRRRGFINIPRSDE